MPVTVKGIENDYTITLCKVNGTPIGELMIDCLKSMSVTLGECDEIELKVYKYYYSQIDKIKHEFYYYDLIKSERIIALNNKQYVIKTIKEDNKNPGGDSGIVVAVIDTGVDYDHEDLINNMCLKPVCAPQVNMAQVDLTVSKGA